MTEQKRFQKKPLNNEDYSGMEKGAKAVKGGVTALFLAGMAYLNKEGLKSVGKKIGSTLFKVVLKKL